jgi:centriolar protein POC1
LKNALHALKNDCFTLTQVSFHPSGDYLVSSSLDSSLKIYDLKEARPVFDLVGHEKAVNSVTFSASGEHIASGGGDATVFLWKSNLWYG